jgi:hypothetical protein
MDLERLGQTALEEFSAGLAKAESDNKTDLGRSAQRLEAKLEQLYALAATMAQRAESLPAVVEIWAGMVTICDQMAATLSQLQQDRLTHSDSYDRILDIRNVCEENRALHA